MTQDWNKKTLRFQTSLLPSVREIQLHSLADTVNCSRIRFQVEFRSVYIQEAAREIHNCYIRESYEKKFVSISLLIDYSQGDTANFECGSEWAKLLERANVIGQLAPARPTTILSPASGANESACSRGSSASHFRRSLTHVYPRLSSISIRLTRCFSRNLKLRG